MCHRKGNGREWSGSIVGEEAKENVPVVSGKTKYAIMKNTLFHREREKERERKRERESMHSSSPFHTPEEAEVN